jgi:hypothetical protein
MNFFNKKCKIFEINNKLFDNGPFYITESGFYYFTENIIINFYNTQQKFWEHQIDNNFGFTAAIIINVSDVEIDMCGFSIEQSIHDFCLQRFFALIQLNDMPFIIGKGPILEKRTELIVPNNLIIKNGTFGLTSHQAILGNNNSNILLSNIRVTNFEVTGITLNNITNLTFENSIIHSSNSNIPISPFFSTFVFIYRILMTIMVLSNNSQEIYRINLILETLIKILSEFIDIIFSIQSLNELYNIHHKFNFFINHKKLSICNVHGIKITGSGPTVNEFHKSINKDKSLNSNNVKINNVEIKNISASVNEELSLAYLDKNVQIGAGVTATFTFLKNKDAFIIIKLIKNLIDDHPSINDNLKSHLSNNQIYNAIEKFHYNIKLHDDEAHFFSVFRNSDSMGHINKGVIAARFGSITHLTVNNLKVKNISNFGQESTLRSKLVHTNNIFKETFFDHGARNILSIIGSNSTGIISSSITNSTFNNISINCITSEHSESIGMFVNNNSESITINNIFINSIKSNIKRDDSSIILIDENCKNISVHNLFFNVDKQACNFRYLFLFFISVVILYIINKIPFSVVILNYIKIFFKPLIIKKHNI